MMLAVVCVVSLVVMGASGQTPSKCCFEKEYTATLGEVGGRVIQGHAAAIQGSMQIAYDFYRKRVGSKNTIAVDGVPTTLYTLNDFASRLTYEKPALGTCTYHHMGDHRVMYPPCVPENSTFLGSSTFGYGSETLKTNNWEVKMEHPNITFKIAVTEDCVPVFDAFYGYFHGSPGEMTFFYTAYHPGIDDMESLNVPDNCVFIENPHNHTGSTPTTGTGNRPIGRRSVRPF